MPSCENCHQPNPHMYASEERGKQRYCIDCLRLNFPDDVTEERISSGTALLHVNRELWTAWPKPWSGDAAENVTPTLQYVHDDERAGGHSAS